MRDVGATALSEALRLGCLVSARELGFDLVFRKSFAPSVGAGLEVLWEASLISI